MAEVPPEVWRTLAITTIPTATFSLIAYILGGRQKDRREDKKTDSETAVGIVNASSSAFAASADRYDKMAEKLEKMQERLIPLELRVQELEGKVGRLEKEVEQRDGFIKVLTMKCRALARMVIFRDNEAKEKDRLIESLLQLFSEQSNSMTNLVKEDKETDAALIRMKLGQVEKTVTEFASMYKANKNTTIEDLINSTDKPTFEEQYLEETIEEAIERKINQSTQAALPTNAQEIVVDLPANIHITQKEN